MDGCRSGEDCMGTRAKAPTQSSGSGVPALGGFRPRRRAILVRTAPAYHNSELKLRPLGVRPRNVSSAPPDLVRADHVRADTWVCCWHYSIFGAASVQGLFWGLFWLLEYVFDCGSCTHIFSHPLHTFFFFSPHTQWHKWMESIFILCPSNRNPQDSSAGVARLMTDTDGTNRSPCSYVTVPVSMLQWATNSQRVHKG